MLFPLPTKLAPYIPPVLQQALLAVRSHFWQLRPPRHLFVFGGRTHYWPGIGRDLYASESVFRATVQQCERHLLDLAGISLLPNFEGLTPQDVTPDETQMQLLVIVIQLALTDLWRAYGVQPDAVLGISSGEAAAMYAAGGLSLLDALRTGLSSRLISQLEPPNYGALTASASYERLAEVCASAPVDLFVVTAAEPTQCGLLCPLADMEVATQYLRKQGIANRLIKAAAIWPYHSPRLIQYEALLREPLQAMQPRPTTRPCYLATLGKLVPVGTTLASDYWLLPPRQPVLLFATLQAALRDGHQVMTPIGAAPFPYFSRSAQKEYFKAIRVLPTLSPTISEAETIAFMRQELTQLGLVRRRRKLATLS